MSPDQLLWTSPRRGGLTSDEWQFLADHLLRRLKACLARSLTRDRNVHAGPGKSTGMSVTFSSCVSDAGPLDAQVRGVFGVSDHEGATGRHVVVQGWLFPYFLGRRVGTTDDGRNHIFLRYAQVDARDDDWEMAGCTGESDWRLLGWESDVYGEFEGLETWDENPFGRSKGQ